MFVFSNIQNMFYFIMHLIVNNPDERTPMIIQQNDKAPEYENKDQSPNKKGLCF